MGCSPKPILPRCTFFFFLLIITTFDYFILIHSLSPLQPLHCHDDESSALMHFKQSLSIIKDEFIFEDPFSYPKVASWNSSSSDCCSWDGVTCDDDTGRVIALDLSNSFLSGFIYSNTTLFRLVHLQRLNLADNYFNESQIPSALGLLSRLSYLNLSYTEFAGQIPFEISNLTKLTSLDLSRNYLLKLQKPGLSSLVQNLTDLKELDLSSISLSGFINSTSTLFHLVHLQRLNLAHNYFNESQIPSAVGFLSRLSYLNLSGSGFAGQIPFEISNLTKLTSLDLSYNSLLKLQKPGLSSLVQNLTADLKQLHLSWVNISSAVPEILANSSSLTSLLLEDCGLHSEFPAGIFNLPNLQFLNIRYNQELSIYLPEFQRRSPLKELGLGRTNFSGGLPNSIENFYSLNRLDISGCNLSGSVPTSISKLSQLRYLSLSWNNFSGSVPTSISKLSQLRCLGLSGNNFSGSVPTSIGNLSQLRYLSLSGNKFSAGSIPSWIGNLAQLDTLYMTSNHLIGQIPSWLMNLTQLTSLTLSYNMLQGPIPDSISQLVNLQSLDFGFNNLSGRVKLDVFLTMKNLTDLDLSYNRLTVLTDSNYTNATLPKFRYLQLASCNLTEFPDFLKTQNELWHLNLSNNRIQDSLPPWIWNMSTQILSSLDLSQNFITAFHQPPPPLVLPWKELYFLDLSSNMLGGSLPAPPSSISVYNVANNKLTGEIPLLICNATSLKVLDLSYNNLSGIIPQCLASIFDSLALLNLRNNTLHGPIPQTYKNGTTVRMINLSQNQLQGPVPRSLVNCSFLESLDLGNNHIDDIFPFWLGTLTNLKVLILRFNRFHGVIWNPNSSFGFPQLHILDLSHNGFTGKLPSDYFHTWTAMKTIDVNQSAYIGKADSLVNNLVNNGSTYALTLTNKGVPIVYLYILNSFTAIDLSSNRFDGEIPESIEILKSLHMLNLSNNNFIGQIPSSLENLTQLESLDLSQNMLSGEIPQQLTQLTFLSFFNASHNHLTGPIPRGRQFDTFENSSYEGNSGLCGEPLSKKCGNLEASPLSKFRQDDYSWFPIDKSDWVVICMGYGGGLVVGLIIGYTLTAKYHEWFVTTFARNQKNQRRKKKCGRRS